MLVGVTVAVVFVLVAVLALAAGGPGGKAGVAAPATTGAADAGLPTHTPDVYAAPRLGLPPRPTPTPVVTGPAQPVDTLQAGDCLQVYPSKTADAYPVVDCASSHIAQVLWRGQLPQPAGASFPGTPSLDTQVSDLCEPHLNWHWVAVWNEDVQVDLRYPDTSDQWASGSRSYYCFVYTFSRHELTGSAVAG